MKKIPGIDFFDIVNAFVEQCRNLPRIYAIRKYTDGFFCEVLSWKAMTGIHRYKEPEASCKNVVTFE